VAIQRVIYRHKIHEAVPLGNEGITYAALTTKTGLSQRRLKSIIRQSALNRVFEETSGQGVRHTASSAVLLRSQAMLDWYGHSLEEMCPSAVALATALEQESGTDQKQEQQNSAFQLAFNTTDPLFRFYERHKDRQARFFGAMAGVGRDQGHSLDYIVRGYDWAKLGKAIVVDVCKSFPSILLLLQMNSPCKIYNIPN
jgi:6-hydroxytryprostatin B O-methyltransferase